MYSHKPVTLRAGEFHLSPNELELAARLEAQRRRLLRLSQVRQQSRDWSARVRRRCRLAEARETRRIVTAERAELAADRLAEADELASAYAAALASLGESHRAADALPDAAAEAAVETAANQAAAQQRHAVALDLLRESRADADQMRRQAADLREAALVTERERSARIAALPPPPPPPYALPAEPPPLVALCDGNAMDTRFYGAPPDGYAVAKATPADAPAVTAADAAEAETARRQAATEAAQRQAEVATERAAARGQTAMRREFVQQAYQQMLTDLAGLHRAELHNRQLQFGQLPGDSQQQHRSIYSGVTGRSQAERVFEQRFLLESASVPTRGDMQLRDGLDDADDGEMRPRPGIPLPTERSPQKPTPDNDNEADENQQEEESGKSTGASGAQNDHLKPLLERINRQKQLGPGGQAASAAAPVDTRLDLSRLVEAGQIRSQVHERLRALERDIAERERFLGEPTAASTVASRIAEEATSGMPSSNPDSGFSTARTGIAPLSSDRQRQQQQLLASRLEPLSEEQTEFQRLESEYAMLEERLARLHGEGDGETRPGEAANDSGAEDLTYRDYNDSDRPAAAVAAQAAMAAASSAPFLATGNNASNQRRDSIASSAASTLNERVREFQRRALQRLGSTQTVSSGGGPVGAAAASVGIQTARSSVGREVQPSLPLSCSCSSCGDYDASSVSEESSTVVSCPRHAEHRARSHQSRRRLSHRSHRPVQEQARLSTGAAATSSPGDATVAAKLRSARRQLEIEREKEDLMQQFLRLRLLQEQRTQLDNLVASLGSTTAAAAAAAAAAAVASTASVSVSQNGARQPPAPPQQQPASASAAEADTASCSCDASSTSVETDYEYDDYDTRPVAVADDRSGTSAAFEPAREGAQQPMTVDSIAAEESIDQTPQWQQQRPRGSPATRDDTRNSMGSPCIDQADCCATIEALPVDNLSARSSLSESAGNSSSAAPSYLPEFLPLAAAATRPQLPEEEIDSNDPTMMDFFLTFGSAHRPPPPAVAIRHPNLAVEQQHELSTIAEVDTPTATTITAAAFSSTLRHQQSQLRGKLQQVTHLSASSVDCGHDIIAEAFGDGLGEAEDFNCDFDDTDETGSCSPCPDGIEISGGAAQLHVQAQKIRLLREYFAANSHRLAELRVSDSASVGSSLVDTSGISQRPLSTAADRTDDIDRSETAPDEVDEDEESTISAIDGADGTAISTGTSPTRTMPLVSAAAATVAATENVAANAESTLGYGAVSQAPLVDSSTVESFNLTTRPIDTVRSVAPPSEAGIVSQVPLADSNALMSAAAATHDGFIGDTNSIVSPKSGALSQAPLSASLTALTSTSTLVGGFQVRLESQSTGLLDGAGVITQMPLAGSSIATTVKPGGSEVGSGTSSSSSGVDVVSQQPLADSSTATAHQGGVGGSDGISQQPLSSSSAASSVVTVAQCTSAVTMPVAATNSATATGESSSISQHHVSSGSPSASLASFRRHESELMACSVESPSATLPVLPATEPPACNIDPLLGTSTNLATICTATEAVRKRAEEKQKLRHRHRDSDVSSSSDIQRDIDRLQTALEAWKASRVGGNSSIDGGTSVARAPAVSVAPVVTKDSVQRKEQDQNAVQRSRRLYQNLEEVQRRRLADERRLERRENLQKAKEFNRQMREQIKKRQQQKQLEQGND